MLIRPPRFEYDVNDLGPSEWRMSGHTFIREDLELKNSRGLTLQCSHYKEKKENGGKEDNEKVPCIVNNSFPLVFSTRNIKSFSQQNLQIYAHGNSGSRMDALDVVQYMLPYCNVFTLDFAGSGLSQGFFMFCLYFCQTTLEGILVLFNRVFG